MKLRDRSTEQIPADTLGKAAGRKALFVTMMLLDAIAYPAAAAGDKKVYSAVAEFAIRLDRVIHLHAFRVRKKMRLHLVIGFECNRLNVSHENLHANSASSRKVPYLPRLQKKSPFRRYIGTGLDYATASVGLSANTRLVSVRTRSRCCAKQSWRRRGAYDTGRSHSL